MPTSFAGNNEEKQQETVSVVFSQDELWLLQGCVRHEVSQQDNWKFPPASLSLNDAIAFALNFCYQYSEKEAAIQLTRHSCLVIDYTVPNNAKDAEGKPVGKVILLKSFWAREALEHGDNEPAIDAQAELTKDKVKSMLENR